MDKKNLKTTLLLLLPVVVLSVLALQFRTPALSVQKVEVLPLSSKEKNDYKDADTKVEVEVKHTPSLIRRFFAGDRVEGGGLDGTYLIDSVGHKYMWPNVITNFSSRNGNTLVNYPIPLRKFSSSVGKVTFISQFSKEKEWQPLPISVIVRQ